MVQGKKQLNSKPKFAEVVIGDNEAKEMREFANARNRRNPYLKLSYPNGVTLILPADIMDNLKDWKGVALMCDLFYQNINLIEEMIKEKKLEGEEKAQFRKDYAEPLWEDFKLWAASAILDVPKDSNIYQALNYMLRNYTELTNYIDIR